MNITKKAVKHPVYITMILIALVIFGLYSIIGMNVAFVSSFDIPMIYVIAIYPGADTVTIEKDVIKIFEDDFVTLPGFSSITSSAKDSLALSMITFKDGVDPYDMLPEVRNRISQFEKDLPKGLSGTPDAIIGGVQMIPIFSFSVETNHDNEAISSYIKDYLIPEVTKINGVTNVQSSGDAKTEAQIELDVELLSKYNIAIQSVYQILNYNNNSLPLGTGLYKEKNVALKYEGGYESIEEIENLTIGVNEDKLIKLKDIAKISLISKTDDIKVKSDSNELIIIDISKRNDGNTLHISNEVKKILERAEKETRGAFKYNIISDDSRIIKASIKNVLFSGVLGVIIAVLIILLLLGDIKATITIALSLPLSILFTFIGMRLFNISINLLSLSGIVIALGSVVDGPIVILEQIYRYYQEKKDEKFLYSVNQAIFRGSDEVGPSIVGSVITTVIVFVPITLLKGIVGQILYDISVTYMLALISSLMIATTIIPYFLKLFLKDNERIINDNAIKRFSLKMQNFYKKTISWSIEKYRFIVFICIIILFITIWSVIQLGITFIPSTDNSDFYVEITFPEAYTKTEIENEMQRAEDLLRKEIYELKTLVNISGQKNTFLNSGWSNSGNIHVILTPVKGRKRDIHNIMLSVQKILDENIPDGNVIIKNGGFDNLVGYIAGGGGFGLTISGDDPLALYGEAKRIESFLKEDPEVTSTSIDTSYETYTLLLDASYDYLSSFGLTSQEAALTSAVLFKGIESGKLKKDGNSYTINLTSNIKDMAINDDRINNIRLFTAMGDAISFSAITDLKTEINQSEIHHTDRAITITINATTTGESTSKLQSRVNEYLEKEPLEGNINVKSGGINKLVEDAISPILTSLAIAWFLVYMVMVFKFENFKQPFLIFMTIPFCIIGVAISLIASGSSLNLVSMLGIISLGGIAVNNGIIFVDYFGLLIKSKRMEIFNNEGIVLYEGDRDIGKLDYFKDNKILKESIEEACHSRLKPILMTALSTMLAVIPMAMAKGEGAEIYAPLGQVIAGGLFASSLISLYLVPILYYIMERRKLRKIYNVSSSEKKREKGLII